MPEFLCEVCGKEMPPDYDPGNDSSGFDHSDLPRPCICSADCYDKVMQPEDKADTFPEGTKK